MIESKVKRFGEVSNLKVGAKGKLEVALKPGDYSYCVIKCELIGRWLWLLRSMDIAACGWPGRQSVAFAGLGSTLARVARAGPGALRGL